MVDQQFFPSLSPISPDWADISNVRNTAIPL